MKKIGINEAGSIIRNMPLGQAIQELKAKLTGQPVTTRIEGNLLVVLDSDFQALEKENEKLKHHALKESEFQKDIIKSVITFIPKTDKIIYTIMDETDIERNIGTINDYIKSIKSIIKLNKEK